MNYNKFIEMVKKTEIGTPAPMLNFYITNDFRASALQEARSLQVSLNGHAGQDVALVVSVLEGVAKNPHKKVRDFIEQNVDAPEPVRTEITAPIPKTTPSVEPNVT